jgi:hypothetical protein
MLTARRVALANELATWHSFHITSAKNKSHAIHRMAFVYL